MKINNFKKRIPFLILVILLLFFSSNSNFVFADESEINRLNSQISQKEKELNKINAEIKRLEASVTDTSNRSKTLQNTINSLENSKKKIETEISETELEIEKAELTLSKLAVEIKDKESLIEDNSEALAESIRRMNSMESVSLLEKFLGYETISDFWSDFEQTQKIQKRLHTEVDGLLKLHQDLQGKEQEQFKQKEQLSSYQIELNSEKTAVDYTQKEKATILQRTKNEEAEYQKMLAEKVRQREAFEKELLEIESQLKFLIDPDSYPTARRGVLKWPVDNVIITQQFGGTAFANTNPHIYGRPFHPGVDFGIPIGTKIKSVAPGTILATGNTDLYPGCNAWGKWIMVEHDNGLSTLYAHLSSIQVSPGQNVNVGQTIGLSGNTGYSTGPHLHLTLYASQGVKVGKYSDYKSGGGCAATGASGPFADLDAYLDPLQYLPNL